jgi:hypothetical protein
MCRSDSKQAVEKNPMLADFVAKVGKWQVGRNNRIKTGKSLNQHCASAADLESMLLKRVPKIVSQQYRPSADARAAKKIGPSPSPTSIPSARYAAVEGTQQGECHIDLWLSAWYVPRVRST